MFNPWFVFAVSLFIFIVQIVEWRSEHKTYSGIKKWTKPLTLAATLAVIVVSFSNGYRSFEQQQQSQRKSDLASREAASAAANTRTKPLSPVVIRRLSVSLRMLGVHSISLACEPNTASLCSDFRDSVLASGLALKSYDIGTLFGGSSHSIVVYANAGFDNNAFRFAGELRDEGLDAIAQPYDPSYKPGYLNTPMPDLHVAVIHY